MFQNLKKKYILESSEDRETKNKYNLFIYFKIMTRLLTQLGFICKGRHVTALYVRVGMLRLYMWGSACYGL